MAEASFTSVVEARISTHEAVCAERYGNLLATVNGMSGRIGKLEGLVWVIAGTLICSLAGLVVTMAFHLPAFK